MALFIVERSAKTEFSVGTTNLSSSTRNKTLAENAIKGFQMDPFYPIRIKLLFENRPVSQDDAYSLLKQPTSKLDWSHASRCSQYWLISRPDPAQSSPDKLISETKMNVSVRIRRILSCCGPFENRKWSVNIQKVSNMSFVAISDIIE